MTLAELRDMPTTIGTGSNGPRIHESCMRSYQVLMKVRQMLLQSIPVPPNIMLEIIDDAMDAPHVVKEIRD